MTEYHNEEFDVEAQQAARDAVMQIPLFPDLDRELIKALGFGAHCKMLQHFCYWMHERKPKMKRRWTLYKTLEEWYGECGLTERQVRKGRKVLVDRGLVTYKRGQYSRVHYRVDWVALADALELDYEDDIPFDFEDDFMSDGNTVENEALNQEFMPDGNTVEVHALRHGVEPILDGNSVDLNTGDYAGDYVQETTLLQRAAEPAFAEPAATDRNGKEEQFSSPPIEDKRHSQDSDTSTADMAAREKVAHPSAPAKPRVATEDELTPRERLIKLYGPVYEVEPAAGE